MVMQQGRSEYAVLQERSDPLCGAVSMVGKEFGAEAHIGTRNGSSLNRGKTCTWSVPQGLSLSDAVAPLRALIP